MGKSYITGTFTRADGTPAAGATLELLISQDCIANDGSGVVIHEPVTVLLDDTGSIPFTAPSVSGTEIFGNDALLPLGTWYTVSVNDPEFRRIYFERLVIPSGNPVNLNLIAPALLP